jgi:dCTP deaminase
MGIAGRSVLLEMIQNLHVVHPADLSLLDGDGYVLTVREEQTLHYLEHKNLVSHEAVFIPPNYVGTMTAKSRYGRLGLSFLNAAKAHSGFVGRLVLELVNLSNDRMPISIKRGEPLMHLGFETRDGDPSVYEGVSYMFQYMTDDEIRDITKIMFDNFPMLMIENL